MKPQGVSIIICCYNSANRLPATIRHIATQRVPPYVPWELIIIDNGSTDGSAAAARREWDKHEALAPLRIVDEPRVGLSSARARGLNEACYEYVIMCDDDNWLAANYVASAFEIMSDRSNIGALGGFGELQFEIEPPVPELCYIFAAGAQAKRTGRVEENKLYGAGCVIRHSAYQKLLGSGFKSLLTDRRGAELTSGGDYELCFALAMMGYDIWYDERLRFQHFITRERLTWQYFVKYAHDSSKSFNVISSYKMIVSKRMESATPWLAVFRNFLSCTRIFLGITVERMIYLRGRKNKPAYFRHLIFSYKLIAYFAKFRDMVNSHKLILEFYRSCRPPQHILKPAPARSFAFLFRTSFFSKPSRQLR